MINDYPLIIYYTHNDQPRNGGNRQKKKKNQYTIMFRVFFSSDIVCFINAMLKCLFNHETRYLPTLINCIDLFILKNMGAAIIDFRVCPPLVKCQNLLFSGFIDTLMYGFSSTGVTIYCYFGLKFNDNTCCEVICKRRYNDNNIMTTNKLPGMYFFFNYRYIPHTKSV